jgi:Family of unknown function (DUF6173)
MSDIDIFKALNFNIPKPLDFHLPDFKSLAQLSTASEIYKHLVEMINTYDIQLDQEHEVGVRLVSFGQSVTLHVNELGYYNPNLIIFHGHLEDGSLVQLIQHISQISFLLTSVKRLDPSTPKRQIGFHAKEENTEK